jgi:hypothetical protein
MKAKTIDQDLIAQELTNQANVVLDPLLVLARTNDPAAFVIAALAVMTAYADGQPAFATWMGSMLTQEGALLLQLGLARGSDGTASQAMATASIH